MRLRTQKHCLMMFFDEVKRVLTERGIPFEAVEVTEGDSP